VAAKGKAAASEAALIQYVAAVFGVTDSETAIRWLIMLSPMLRPIIYRAHSCGIGEKGSPFYFAEWLSTGFSLMHLAPNYGRRQMANRLSGPPQISIPCARLRLRLSLTGAGAAPFALEWAMPKGSVNGITSQDVPFLSRHQRKGARQRAANELFDAVESASGEINHLRTLAIEDDSIDVSELNQFEEIMNCLADLAETIATDEEVDEIASSTSD
jgi:hypothetical protein